MSNVAVAGTLALIWIKHHAAVDLAQSPSRPKIQFPKKERNGGSVMPITPFLQDGHFFDLDHVKAMSEAFTQVCEDLGLKERDDPLTRLVARRIH